MKIKRKVEIEEEVELLGATLLSREEAVNLLTYEERAYSDWYWLRSPCSSSNAWRVNTGGTLGNYSVTYSYATRPALILKSPHLEVGDEFEFGGKEFRVISDTLAFCKTDIGESRFDRRSSNYENSEIKMFIDAWFEKAMREMKEREIDDEQVESL